MNRVIIRDTVKMRSARLLSHLKGTFGAAC
jgi:hypothetical protein